MKLVSVVIALSLLPAAAFAQGSNADSVKQSRARRGVPWSALAPMFNNDHSAAGVAARDGCVNVPGEAHNSADCSRLPRNALNTQNTATTDLSGRPTGASENAERNARILSGQSDD
jgi:hypothetical protein